MQSREIEMRRLVRTVTRLLMRMSRHRAELFMERQAAVGTKFSENYRSNAGGWN
jgi:hypothetical protein